MKRLCRECGLEWNVSVLEKGTKRYICPRCAGTPWYGSREWGVKREREGKRRYDTNGGLQTLERGTERCTEGHREDAAL